MTTPWVAMTPLPLIGHECICCISGCIVCPHASHTWEWLLLCSSSSQCRDAAVCCGSQKVISLLLQDGFQASPLCRPNPKCILIHQPSPEDTLLWGESAASREGPHQVPPQWECLICYVDVGLGSSQLRVDAGQEADLDHPLSQSLTKGGVGQDSPITCPAVPSYIYELKPVVGIHNSKNNRVVYIVIKRESQRKGEPLTRPASHPGHQNTEGSSTALQTAQQWISSILFLVQPETLPLSSPDPSIFYYALSQVGS